MIKVWVLSSYRDLIKPMLVNTDIKNIKREISKILSNDVYGEESLDTCFRCNTYRVYTIDIATLGPKENHVARQLLGKIPLNWNFYTFDFVIVKFKDGLPIDLVDRPREFINTCRKALSTGAYSGLLYALRGPEIKNSLLMYHLSLGWNHFHQLVLTGDIKRLSHSALSYPGRQKLTKGDQISIDDSDITYTISTTALSLKTDSSKSCCIEQ